MTAARMHIRGPIPANSQYVNATEHILFRNQSRFISQVQPELEHISNLYSEHFTMNPTHFDEMVQHVSDPHPKRKLREQCMKDLIDTGEVARREFVASVLYKLKREEYAKPGKFPRMIGDLGVAASLQGYRPMEKFKEAQSSKPYEFDGGYAQFVKTPDPVVLKKCFDDLIDPPGNFVFIYFSDDACYSYRDGEGKVHMMNLDISSCDTSHGPGVFETLKTLAPSMKHDIQVLIDQCSKPIRIESCSKYKRVVLLKPRFPRLYSGSTLTTSINNVANLLIIMAIRRNPHLSVEDAALKAGYIITKDTCKRPEDLQFLKCSPVRDARGYQPFLNIGVLLRMSGACKGDLPGKGSVTLRAQQFQGELLNGYMTHGHFPLLDAFKSNFPLRSDLMKKKVTEDFEYKLKTTTPTFHTDQAVLERYDLSGYEFEDLKAFFLSKTGYTTGNSAISKILAKDYGLECNFVCSSVRPLNPIGPMRFCQNECTRDRSKYARSA